MQHLSQAAKTNNSPFSYLYERFFSKSTRSLHILHIAIIIAPYVSASRSRFHIDKDTPVLALV
jgi:hypothetical protein